MSLRQGSLGVHCYLAGVLAFSVSCFELNKCPYISDLCLVWVCISFGVVGFWRLVPFPPISTFVWMLLRVCVHPLSVTSDCIPHPSLPFWVASPSTNTTAEPATTRRPVYAADTCIECVRLGRSWQNGKCNDCSLVDRGFCYKTERECLEWAEVKKAEPLCRAAQQSCGACLGAHHLCWWYNEPGRGRCFTENGQYAPGPIKTTDVAQCPTGEAHCRIIQHTLSCCAPKGFIGTRNEP